MQSRTFWISGAAFALLLVATWWILSGRTPTEEIPFFTLKQRTPDTLWVAFRGDTTVVVPGGVNGWRIVAPVQDAADGVVVNALIHHLSPLEIQDRYPLTPRKLDTYGMRVPREVIRAVYRDLPPDTLLVGGFGLNASWDYVRSGSAPEVAAVDDRIVRTYLFKELHDLRDTQLLPFTESRAETLRLRGPGGVLNLEAGKAADGSWSLSAPYPGPVTPKKMREYLSSVNHMHIEVFADSIPLDSGITGLDAPQAAAQVVTRDGRTVGVRLGRRVPGTDRVYAQTEGRGFTLEVSDRYLPVLGRPADDLRQEAPVTFGLADVDSILVRTPRHQRTFRLGTEVTPESDRAAWDVLGNWILLRADGFRRATPAARRRWGLVPDGPGLVWMAGEDTLAVMVTGPVADGEFPVWIPAGTRARPGEILLLPEGKAVPLWTYLRREAGEASP